MTTQIAPISMERPLEDITVDIIGALPKTNKDNKHVVIITDRYSKLTCAIPMRKITAGIVAAAFIDNWVLAYHISDSILTDNGSQFVAKLFEVICHLMGIKPRTTNSYLPQTSVQAER